MRIRPLPSARPISPGDPARPAVRGSWARCRRSGVGGKWTTYRAFAEETVDMVLSDFGDHGRRAPGPANRRRGIFGRSGGWSGADDAAFPRPRRASADLYGTRADEVADFCARLDDEPLPAPRARSRGSLGPSARSWHCSSDGLQRRSPLAIRGCSPCLCPRDSENHGRRTGWSEAQTAEEDRRFLSELETYPG